SNSGSPGPAPIRYTLPILILDPRGNRAAHHGISLDRSDQASRQNSADVVVGMPRQQLTQVLVSTATIVEFTEQALDGVRNVGGRATVTDRPGDGCKFADAAADAEVVGVDHLAIYFCFFAFEADVGNPMLTATVRASGDVQAYLFLKAGDAVVQLLGEPAGEAFGFSQSQFAELRAGAGDGAASKCGSADRKSGGGEFGCHSSSVLVRDVYDQQVLHHGVADVTVGIAIAQIGCQAQLLG